MSASVTLTHAGVGSSLELVPDAGMVALSWTVAGDEVLALPCGRDEFLAAARTGGIPLLYPYANRLQGDRFVAAGMPVDLSRAAWLKRDDKGHPIHGLLLRRGGWALTVLGPGSIEAEMAWQAHPELVEAYPFAHTLRVTWTMAAGAAPGSVVLRVDTTVAADRGMAVPAAFGWHPYLRVQDPSQARIRIAPCAQVALDAGGLPTQAALESACRQCDAGSAQPLEAGIGQGHDALMRRASVPTSGTAGSGTLAPVASLVDAHRRIDVRMDGNYPWVQLFSPRGAAFACIEPMVAATNALASGSAPVVAAGAALTAAFEIEVTPCPPPTGPAQPRSPSART